MQKKRLILILLSFAGLMLLGLAAYFFYFKKLPSLEKPPATEEVQPPAQEGNITQIDEQLKKISTTPAVSPVITADGAHVMYVGKTAGMFEVDFSGANQKEVAFAPLKNLYKVLWSKDRAEFAAIYANPEGKKIFYYNTPLKQMEPYAPAISSLSFSPSANKIAYYHQEANKGINNISVADPNSTNATTVINTRLQDARITWINENEIAISTPPSGLAPNVLWLLNTGTQKLFTVLTDMYGLTTLWAQGGEQFLYSQTSQKGKDLSLWASDKRGASAKETDIATLPEKCTFTKDEAIIICVAPKEMPDIIWPDDYYKNQYTAQEQIWRVNLVSKKKDLLYEFSTISFDATNLILSPQEDLLVFLNKKDGYLYSIKLK